MLNWILLLHLLFSAGKTFSQKKLTYRDKFFIYTLTVDSTISADNVNCFCTVRSISIHRRKDNRQIQVIHPMDNSPSCTLPEEQIFIVEDVNFDGNNDIRLLQFLPAASNLPYYYWIYNPKKQLFQRQSSLEDITSPEFDLKKKLIYSFWRDGCCDHGSSTYKYINDNPTLIGEEEVKEEEGKIISTIKKRVNGKMKLIKRTVEKADEN